MIQLRRWEKNQVPRKGSSLTAQALILFQLQFVIDCKWVLAPMYPGYSVPLSLKNLTQKSTEIS